MSTGEVALAEFLLTGFFALGWSTCMGMEFKHWDYVHAEHAFLSS